MSGNDVPALPDKGPEKGFPGKNFFKVFSAARVIDLRAFARIRVKGT
jgi:hypothetical protein